MRHGTRSAASSKRQTFVKRFLCAMIHRYCRASGRPSRSVGLIGVDTIPDFGVEPEEEKKTTKLDKLENGNFQPTHSLFNRDVDMYCYQTWRLEK